MWEASAPHGPCATPVAGSLSRCGPREFSQASALPRTEEPQAGREAPSERRLVDVVPTHGAWEALGECAVGSWGGAACISGLTLVSFGKECGASWGTLSHAVQSFKSWRKTQRPCQSKEEQKYKWTTGQKGLDNWWLLLFFYPAVKETFIACYFIINQYILTPGQCCISPDITHSYLEQETTGRNKSTQPDEQLPVNSKGSMQQKSNELVNEATYEGIELPEQKSRNFQVISPHLGDETAHCTTEKSNIMEHRNNDLHYKCMIPCQVTSDLKRRQ